MAHKEFYITDARLPVFSWCPSIDSGTMDQVANLATHQKLFHHVALMPDAHLGYGMPIGGVIACDGVLIPNAVGVDIGCGMRAVETDFAVEKLSKAKIAELIRMVKTMVPVGEGHAHARQQSWAGFGRYLSFLEKESFTPPWFNPTVWKLAERNLGTLGGGNHFMELQSCEQGRLWLMIHSGSRNLGYKIADCYHRMALKINMQKKQELPSQDLAYLELTTPEGQAYLRDMNFALEYARKNRANIMECFRQAVHLICPEINFGDEIDIHHNYAALETHFSRQVWIHRKGATSACQGETGIIPGSMGTGSYIVEGLGCADSFHSCSHGAGRVMGRNEASRTLTREQADASMRGIVFDGWARTGGRRKSAFTWDLGEAPAAYKNIDTVIEAELDLIKPIKKLQPLGVIKG